MYNRIIYIHVLIRIIYIHVLIRIIYILIRIIYILIRNKNVCCLENPIYSDVLPISLCVVVRHPNFHKGRVQYLVYASLVGCLYMHADRGLLVVQIGGYWWCR